MPNDYKMMPKYEFTAMEEQAMRESARQARMSAAQRSDEIAKKMLCKTRLPPPASSQQAHTKNEWWNLLGVNGAN